MSFLPGPLSGGQTMQRLQSVVPQGGTRRPMLRLRRSHDRQRPHWLRLQLQGGDPYLILSNSTLDNKLAQAVAGASGFVKSVSSSACVEPRISGDAYPVPAGDLRQPGPSSG